MPELLKDYYVWIINMLFNAKSIMLLAALSAIPQPTWGTETDEGKSGDSLRCDGVVCDDASLDACDGLGSSGRKKKGYGHLASGRYCDFRYRTPTMIGDYFGGSPMGFRGDSVLDRLFVIAEKKKGSGLFVWRPSCLVTLPGLAIDLS